MSTCTQRDGADVCGGDVDALGYCARCGVLAAPAAPPVPVPPTPASVVPASVVPVPAGAGRGSSSKSPGPGRRSSSMGGDRRARHVAERDDPRAKLMVDPALPERRRRCRNPQCLREVGQRSARDGAGRVTGFCTACGWGWSARPPLQPDATTGATVVVADRYEVLGALGRGGLGWVYLALDRRLDRYVVLKGLLDPDDPQKRTMALDELKALAEANHPNIVTVHDFVQHAHPLPPPGGEMLVDYIVMEYIHGESLLQRFQARRRTNAYLSVAEAAEALLPALAGVTHLHERGLVHNDFKPDNVMVAESGHVSLVDLGAVSVAGGAPGYGTVGYRDPHGNPPSAQTDIYAIGRALGALTMPVPGFVDEKPLPGPGTEELLERHRSFHLLLQRATHRDPDRRFATVDELADQLRAVVREVEALGTGEERPGLSEVFGPEVRVVGTEEFPRVPTERTLWALSLPQMQVDPRDPHARRLATLATAGPEEVLAAVEALPEVTTEARLQAVRAQVALLAGRIEAARPGPGVADDAARLWARGCAALADGDTTAAAAAFDEAADARPDDPGPAAALDACARHEALAKELAAIAAAEPDDVRVPWLQGVAALVLGAVRVARGHFDGVLAAVPGEAAPKLAGAACAELLDDHATAARHYATVWRTDHGYVGAAFGLARALVAQGAAGEAIAVLGGVPSSSQYAQAAALGALAAADPVAATDAALAADFFARADRLDGRERLRIDPVARQKAVVAALRVAAAWVDNGRPWPQDGTAPREELLGVPLHPRGIRDGMEIAYRRMAAETHDEHERVACVDRANRERNWSIW